MAQLGRFRILFPAAACALAGHAVAYGTLWPSGAAHGYFAWYEPLFGAVSAGVVAGLAALLVLGLAGNVRAKRFLRTAIPGREASLPRRAHRLALTSLAVLLLQETLEASVSSGRFAAGGFSGLSLLLLLAFLWAASFGLVYAARTYGALARLASRLPGSRLRVPQMVRPRFLDPRLGTPSPLAVCRGLRAPPLLSA